MSVAHTSHIRIEKHQGPHRTAHVEGFSDAIDFGIHGGIKHFYQETPSILEYTAVSNTSIKKNTVGKSKGRNIRQPLII